MPTCRHPASAAATAGGEGDDHHDHDHDHDQEDDVNVFREAHDRQHAVRQCACYPRWRWFLLRWWRRYVPMILVHCGCCLDHRALHDMRLDRRGGGTRLVVATCRQCIAHSPDECQHRDEMIWFMTGGTAEPPRTGRT